MPIQFTLDTSSMTLLCTEELSQADAPGHSCLSRDHRYAWTMLEKLRRIHARQAASCSPAAQWEPLKIWAEMLKDCCSDPATRG